MGLASLTVLGLASIAVTATLNVLGGWTLDDICPGSDTFCNGVFWTAAVDYLPGWLFVAQILVVLALTTPIAVVRTGR